MRLATERARGAFLAIIPLVIVWFGRVRQDLPHRAGQLVPMYLNTALGIRQVDPKLVALARIMGLRGPALILGTSLPGALPSILNGVRLALTTAWLPWWWPRPWARQRATAR